MADAVGFVGANPKVLIAPSLVDASEAVLAAAKKGLNPTGRASSDVPLHLVVMASDVYDYEIQPICSVCSCLTKKEVATSKTTHVLAVSSLGKVVVGKLAGSAFRVLGEAAAVDVVVSPRSTGSGRHINVESMAPGVKTHVHMNGTQSHQKTSKTFLGALGTFDNVDLVSEMIQQAINELVEAGVTGRVAAAPTTIVNNITSTTVVNTIVAAAPQEMAREQGAVC